MSYRDRIPEAVLESSNVDKFISVLDGIQDFKTSIISKSLQSYNLGLLYNREWVIKRLLEVGVKVPTNYPLEPLRQLLLNVDTILRCRGSSIGLELICSVLTLGEVSVDASRYWTDSTIIQLDSVQKGFITDDEVPNLFLCSELEEVSLKGALSITIRTPYAQDVVQDFVMTACKEYLTFNDADVSITYEHSDNYHFHRLLNKFFTI